MTGLQKGISLRGIEVFEALAQTGSVAAAAARLGMSAPAVSQQMKNLDSSLGTALIDHSRRPMTLTPAGRQFLKQAETALSALRIGQRDLTALDLSAVSSLRIGIIEDFENVVTPTLTSRLAGTMAECAFQLHTSASHQLLSKLEKRELDIAICAAGRTVSSGILSYPILEDPYILAVPKGVDVTGGLTSFGTLVFLRRDPDQVMGQQIHTQLSRQGIELPNRFEIDSNQSISALVANGTGWTITTPLSLLRAGRFADEIDAHPLPFVGFSRQIMLYSAADWSGDIPGQIADIARGLIGDHFVQPGLQLMPWLEGRFTLIGN
jgi:DNA-binding transcriptional LysR family regulator